ncbi:MAG: glycosyltransferase family 2 protein [Armatimonadetes bacterium]|nr:glycosyltransferase family 2 protein [Armatimonadota bacterium]
MADPKVSAIIPAYNAEATIAEAIESAKSQTHLPDEIIVANDGSTDRTSHIAREFGVTVIDLPKANGAVARNEGARVAKGEVLFFLDADDLWMPKKIEEHLAIYSSQTPGLVLDQTIPFNSKGELSWRGGLPIAGPLRYNRLINHRAWPSGSGFSVLKSLYWAVDGFHPSLIKFQDVDFWIRVASAWGSFYSLGKPLTRYRVNDNSVSKGTANHLENLNTMFEGWPFATDAEKTKMRRIASLLVAEVRPFPASARFLLESGPAIADRFFWKCLLGSIKRTIHSKV